MKNADKNRKRLLSKVTYNNKCMEYNGAISSNGYGVFYLNGKSYNAHKASYILHFGEISNNKWVLHKCDNKKCINPNHLYIGDREQNTRDAIIRKRMASGINHGTKTKPKSFKRCNSILSDAECLKIKSSDLSKINLSKKYNVHISTIYRAITHADELLKQLENK